MTQDKALDLMAQGRNIFLTGPPGCGKSYLIEKFVQWAQSRHKQVALTATTGIAACLIGGTTIHSWAGMGIGSVTADRAVTELNQQLIERIVSCEILIIDEISMLEASRLDWLNQLLKDIRSSPKPFGGLQTILVGDFFQLPPVSADKRYAFEASSWQELDLIVCQLTEQHRQGADELYAALNALRDKQFEACHLEALLERQRVKVPADTSMLLTHNKAVDELNYARLSELGGEAHRYRMRAIGRPEVLSQFKRSILSPEELILKTGAKVMFTANNLDRGFVNGSQGIVVGFARAMPVVELDNNGLRLTVEPQIWRYQNDTVAEISQLPLRLAWAITIHKSQGLNLDRAVIDLRRSFVYGMGYVALSRLRSYRGLYLKGLNTRSLQLDPKVHKFYQQITSETAPTSNSEDTLSRLKALLAAGVSSEFIKISLGVNPSQIEQAKRSS